MHKYYIWSSPRLYIPALFYIQFYILNTGLVINMAPWTLLNRCSPYPGYTRLTPGAFLFYFNFLLLSSWDDSTMNPESTMEAKVNYKGVNFKICIPIPVKSETSESWVKKVKLVCEIGGCPAARQKLFCKALWNGMLCTEGKESVDLTRVCQKLDKAKQKMPTIRMIGWDGDVTFQSSSSQAKATAVSSWLPSLHLHFILAAAIFALLAAHMFRSRSSVATVEDDIL